ncbi:hypothetical protein SEMRO_1007_G230400.1 [Seminavis robusta]|uniref:Uncharacterized protein n=1 Tax=Seminavis robusta TaxID=568900 RepID=A0A9N8EDT8_9STRA|nr:hypothetical protein SEMRO_1007_G230400.1 [Seminavis robusta]|eukprot:Sro1007_g230400.1 n/a (326) ;mRNA; r:17258-18325
MTSFTATDYFSHAQLTPIPPEEKPTFSNLKIIHQEINANAMAVTSRLAGGHYGHLALTVPTATFNALENATAWVEPVHPGPNPVHGATATAAQITETNRLFAQNMEQFIICKAVGTALKKQLLEAIPDTFTNTLKNDLFGYANVSVLALLEHLDTTYGKVDRVDLKDNIDRMNAKWSPTQPIEDLFTQIEAAKQFAKDHDPITEMTTIIAATTNLTNSGVFTQAIREWDNKEDTDHTWKKLELHFKKADKERRRTLTAAEVGYANAATDKAKITGHRKEATADNMMGGCCIIKRRNGERAIYRRPNRNPPRDENTPPNDQTTGGR